MKHIERRTLYFNNPLNGEAAETKQKLVIFQLVVEETCLQIQVAFRSFGINSILHFDTVLHGSLS